MRLYAHTAVGHCYTGVATATLNDLMSGSLLRPSFIKTQAWLVLSQLRISALILNFEFTYSAFRKNNFLK